MGNDSWWRFYNTAPDHPKVLRLTDSQFRAWITMNSLASKMGGEVPTDFTLITQALRRPPGKARDLLQALLSAGLWDQTERGFRPHNWHEKQFKSDVSTERVRAFRERHGNVSVTAHSTETEAETERKKKEVPRARRAAARVSHPRFEEFWGKCPKRKAKAVADKAFSAACRDVDPDILIAGMAKFAASQAGKDPEFIAHPATWLNQKRWLDEDSAPQSTGATIHVLSRETQEIEQENLKKMGVI